MRVGVIGCGSIGARYARWLSEMGLDVGVHDADRERMASLTGMQSLRRFDRAEALLEWGPSHVVVATPPNAHRTLSVAALESGAKVLVEKPIAVTVEDAIDMVEAARRAAQSLFVVCNMRFHPGVAALRDALDSIGRPLFARAYFGHLLRQMRPAGTDVYASSQSAGGGVVLDCIHELDYLRWFFGELRTVHAWLGRIGEDRLDADDHCEAMLESRSGVRISLHLDFLMPFKRRGAEICGTDGSLVWQSEGKAPEVCDVWFADRSGRRTLRSVADVPPESPYKAMLEAFLDARAGLQSGEDGLDVLRTAHQIVQ